MNNDNSDWMSRMAQHSALTHFVSFMVDKNNKKNCVAIKIKETGELIYDGDIRIQEIIGPCFSSLNEACFYNFAKDMGGGING